MANRPSINLDRINEGDSITVTKSYNGTGKLCSNGSTMFGVLNQGVEKNLFVHQDADTVMVIDHLNNMPVNTSVTIASNRGGGYSLDGSAVESAKIIVQLALPSDQKISLFKEDQILIGVLNPFLNKWWFN